MMRFTQARTTGGRRILAGAFIAAALAVSANAPAAPAAPTAPRPAGDYEAGSPYAHRIAYLKQLRQVKVDGGDAAGAGEVAGQIERLARTEGDEVNAAYGALGRIASTAESQPAAALSALNALDSREAVLDAPEFTASLQQAYGDIYLALGQYDFALSHYLHALDLCMRYPGLREPTPNALRLAIAKLKVYTRSPAQVLETLHAIDPAGGALSPGRQVRRHVIEGIAEGMLGHTDRSLQAYSRGLAIARANGLVMLEASALANMADSYLLEKRWPDAERHARAGLAAAQRAGDVHIARTAMVNLGIALAGQGRVAEGLGQIDAASTAMRADGSWPDLVNTLEEKSALLERLGDYRQALAALQERQDIGDRLTAAERANAVTVLQEQFDAQRRAAENDTLRRENAMKDTELRKRRLWQIVASVGAAAALLLCAVACVLYRRSALGARRLRVLNDELAFHSTHDTLTGLLNRRSFRDTMTAREQSGREADQCFVLLDIDHFKSINDRHGHAVGDAVLVEVARRLQATVGERGAVLRWGGEEFLVHIDGLLRAQHAGVVRELLDAVAAGPVVAGEGTLAHVTISAGALSMPGDAVAPLDWQQALALADHALYRAKDAGRHCGFLVDGRLAGAGIAGLLLEHIAPSSGGSSTVLHAV